MRQSLHIALVVACAAVATGCAGKSDLMRLKPDVLNLVPQEDRARLDPFVTALNQARQDVQTARDAVTKTREEGGKARSESRRAELLATAMATKVAWLQARQARQESEVKAQEQAARSADAEHEYQRALLAFEKGLVPYEGFSAKKYEAQFHGTRKALAEAKQEVEKAAKSEKKAESDHKKAQERLDKFKD